MPDSPSRSGTGTPSLRSRFTGWIGKEVKKVEETFTSHEPWEPSLDRPSLVIVFSPKPKTGSEEKWSFLKAATIASFKQGGLLSKSFLTKEDSALKGRQVVVLSAQFESLLHQAELIGLPKLQNWGNGLRWTPFVVQGTEMARQMPFVGLNHPDRESKFFTESEILILLRNLAYSCKLPGAEGEEIAGSGPSWEHARSLADLCERYSTLKIAEHAGAVEAIMAMHTQVAEELSSDFRTCAKKGPLSNSDPKYFGNQGSGKRIRFSSFNDYFGSNVTNYFLFMHTYCKWLLIPAIVGSVCFCLHHFLDPDSTKVNASIYTMGYGLMMTVWTTLFMERIKRALETLRYKSGSASFEHTRNLVSPIQFYVSEDILKGNRILGELVEIELKDGEFLGIKYCLKQSTLMLEEIEPEGAIHSWNDSTPPEKSIQPGDQIVAINGIQTINEMMSEVEKANSKSNCISTVKIEQRMRSTLPRERTMTYLITISATFFVFGVTAIVIWFLLWLYELPIFAEGNVVMQNVPTLIYLVVTAVFQGIYEKVGDWLTRMEGHAVYSEFVKSSCSKSAMFQLVNYYGWFWYVAFWQQDLAYLRNQLLIFMTVKQIIGNLQETGGESVTKYFKKSKKEDEAQKTAEAKFLEALEEQYALPETDLSSEFLEMAVAFGSVTMFAAVFPMGGLLALCHCWYEMYSDSYKLFRLGRRLLPKPGHDEVVLETWMSIFEGLSVLSVVFNTALLALAWKDRVSLLTFVLIEHGLLFFKSYLSWSIPDCPEWVAREEMEVEQAVRVREASIARQHLCAANAELCHLKFGYL